jgi:hypothetical protein
MRDAPLYVPDDAKLDHHEPRRLDAIYPTLSGRTAGLPTPNLGLLER